MSDKKTFRRTDRTDAGCAFTARYRLRATREARAYRFRALVPAQPGYPYLRGRDGDFVVVETPDGHTWRELNPR